MRKFFVAWLAALGAALCAATAGAADAPADDLDALTLADKAPEASAQPARPWRVFVEGALGRGNMRDSDSRFAIVRAALDVRADLALTEGLRAVFSDRLDLDNSDGEPPGENVNTLREAYLSWARREDQIFDLGRVNVRNGAAMGFNPTDWFKEDALRTYVNPDPAAVRENRQGTVVVQAQQLWSQASLTATFSPKLARSADPASFALNAGATNPRNRWLLAGSYKFGDRINPQLLLYGGADTPTQLGLNLATLIGDAVVVFGELSAGKGASLVALASSAAEDRSSQRRAAAGLTFTTAFKLSVTAEAEYNSAAPTADQWNALSAPAQQQLLAKAQALQDLPTRVQWFLHATWNDLLVPRFDLAGFLRRDRETRSDTFWLEARYRWGSTELAAQWQAYSGASGSLYHAVPQRSTGQLVLRLFF